MNTSFMEWMQRNITAEMKLMDKKRIEKIRKEATIRVNKEALVQFRIEPEIMDRLYEEANKLGLPVGTMVRMWVMERLNEKSA
jgi:predicted DNA binding CopG/RHH family protein